VDEDDTMYIVDYWNHRIVAWKRGGTAGRVVAGGKGQGSRMDQLNGPTDMLIDTENDSLLICDKGNRRVMRWSLRSGTIRPENIIDNILCSGMAMDDEGHLYVTDIEKHDVRQYRRGEKTGTIVAGGKGGGNGLDQLNRPCYVSIDGEGAVYVSDGENHRVMKWMKGATEGIVVAGNRGKGEDLTQLWYPKGVVVDAEGTVYVAEGRNERVTRWYKGMDKGEIIADGNGGDRFMAPYGLSFDRHGHLYVAEFEGHRVQRFDIETTS